MSIPIQNRIPAAFRHMRRFLFSKRVPNAKTGKFDKIPCDFNGHACSAHDPAKWLTLSELLSSPIALDNNYSVAIVIYENGEATCVDLDGAIDQFGNITPAAAAIVAMFPGAYIEVSVSGRGLHIFFRTIGIERHKTVLGGGVGEAYTRARFIDLTGDRATGDAGIDHTAAFNTLIDRFGLRFSAEDLAARIEIANDVPRAGSTGQYIPDDQLIDIMLNSKGSAAYQFDGHAHPRDLWFRNEEVLTHVWPKPNRADGCPFDHSAADAALMYHLSFYTGGHIARMLRLFERSALCRPHLSAKDVWRKNSVPIFNAVGTGKYYDRPPAGAPVQLPPPPAPVVPSVPGIPAPTGAYDGDPYAAARGHAQAALHGTLVPGAPRVIPMRPALVRTEYDLPKRQYLFGSHYMRGEVGITAAPGATGKSAVAVVESVSMVTMRRLLRDIPDKPLRVIYFGEDTAEELERRFITCLKHYGIDRSEIANGLVFYSFRDEPLCFVRRTRDGATVNRPDLDAFRSLIGAHHADVVILDTMRHIHACDENDNGDMQLLIATLNQVAAEFNCAIELLDHTRKASNRGTIENVDDIRGASAKIFLTRSARLVVKMTDNELNVDERDRYRYFRFGDAKTNTTPPPNKSDWMRLESVQLANGDNVQVATVYTPQNITVELTNDQIAKICNDVECGQNRVGENTGMWAGYLVAKVLNIEIDKDMISGAARRSNVQKVKKVLVDLV